MSGETKTRKSARLSDVRHRLYIDIATATPEKTSAETPKPSTDCSSLRPRSTFPDLKRRSQRASRCLLYAGEK